MKKIISVVIGAILIIGVIVAIVSKKDSAPVVTTSDTTRASSTVQSARPPAVETYTLADVSAHKDATSCWSVVNGKVYDLTSWINGHPGGKQAILGICGKDGSAAFNAQHGGQANPASQLEKFYIGDLAQ